MIFRKVSEEKSCTLTMCPGFTFSGPVYFLPASRAIVPILRHRRGAASSCVNSRAKRPAPATPRPLAYAIVSDEPTYSGIGLEDLCGTQGLAPSGDLNTAFSKKLFSCHRQSRRVNSFNLNELNRHSIGSFNHGRAHVPPRVNLFENLDPFGF